MVYSLVVLIIMGFWVAEMHCSASPVINFIMKNNATGDYPSFLGNIGDPGVRAI